MQLARIVSIIKMPTYLKCLNDNLLFNKHNSVESFDNLYNSIKEVLNKSRQQAYQAVNSSMLLAYWSIGKIIVENEQDG